VGEGESDWILGGNLVVGISYKELCASDFTVLLGYEVLVVLYLMISEGAQSHQLSALFFLELC